MSEQEITEVETKEADEREAPTFSTEKNMQSHRNKVYFFIICIVAIVAIMFVNGVFSSKEKEKENTSKAQIGTLPPVPEIDIKQEIEQKKETPPPPPPPSVINTGQLAPPVLTSTRNQTQEITPDMRKRNSGSLVDVQNTSNSNQRQQNQQAPDYNNAMMSQNFSQGDLSDSLKPVRLQGSQATTIKNPTFMMTQGQFLNAILETAIDSTVTGMTRAILSNNIYSTNGKMVLLEKGTRLIGQYQRGLDNGQARLFVLWTRAETPNGIIVNLDSAGTDQLGRAGVTGYVNTHFFKRFGTAIMFSLIDDIGQYLVSKVDESTTVELSSTESGATDAVSTILEKSMDIPPTLIKHQGDTISIFLSRDIDFSGVYGIAIQ